MPKMHQTLTFKTFRIITSLIFFAFLGAIFIAIYLRYYQNPKVIQDNDDLPLMKIETNMILTGKIINKRYTCDGDNVSPELTISKVPSTAKTLVVIMQDANSNPGGFVHRLLRNIPAANTVELKEGKMPLSIDVGINDFGKTSYGGPCPPVGQKHQYYIKVYALDTTLDLDNGANIYQLQGQMNSRIITKSELMLTYAK